MADPRTVPSVSLQRWGSQTPVQYSEAELDLILAHLSAASTQSTLGYDDVWFAAASPFLLIVDVRWSVNRRLSELFEIAMDRTKPFNLRFVSDESAMDLTEAMTACGYIGGPLLNTPQLAGVYMTLYRSQTGLGDYATNVGGGVQLVADGGGDAQPARIRTISGGDGVQVALNSTGDSIVLTAPLPPPAFSLQSVSDGIPLLADTSSLNLAHLRGLTATSDVQLNVMPSGKDISIGLATQLSAVRDVKPPGGTMSVVGVLRVDPETGIARIEMSQPGSIAWNITASAPVFSISSPRADTAYLNLQTNATLNGLVVTSKW